MAINCLEKDSKKPQKIELAGNTFKTANIGMFKNVEKIYIINEQIRILRKLIESTKINQIQILELKTLIS